MNFKVEPVTPEAWAQISEAAHAAAFGEMRPSTYDRIDFALLVTRKNDTPEGELVGYVTCAEVNAHILSWRFGGAFKPLTASKANVMAAYRAAHEWCRPTYAEGARPMVDVPLLGWSHITTMIKNDNVASMKLALGLGYRVIGVQHFGGETLVEMHLELKPREVI